MKRPSRAERPRQLRALLVDSGAWIGLLHARDRHHTDARRLFRAALDQKLALVTTNLVLAEVQRLLLHRVGFAASDRFLDRLDQSPSLEILFPALDEHEAARRWLTKLADQRITYTDAVSFSLLARNSRLGVLTFDSDYSVAGFPPWTGT